MPKELVIKEPSFYYSYQDEKHFYDWLESIDGIDAVRGGPQGLVIRFKGNGLNRRDLFDLIALLTRYGVDMLGLRDLVTARNESWIKNRQSYWYSRIFGEGQTLRSVYLLQHVAREGSNDEDVKVLGIYSNESKAKRAIERLVKLPGFNRHPEGFYVDRYQLDKSDWIEGFVTRRSRSGSANRTRKSRSPD